MKPAPQAGLTADEKSRQLFAIRLSLIVGLLMLAGKWYAYGITGSAAILSDAAESVVHILAVGFAVFSMRFSHLPADDSHPYGHEKIAYFSAGAEGGLIVLAAVFIIFEAVNRLIHGAPLENMETGTSLVLAASLINLALGEYLVWEGKRARSLILIANGKHVLTDAWTSFGVVAGLVLVIVTGWSPFDPLVAILVAANILWTGAKLLRESIGGLMDEGSPELGQSIRASLDNEVARRNLRYHELRYRVSGVSVWVEYHLLFPSGVALEDAHRVATEIENSISASLPSVTHITSHLEPAEHHDIHHR